MRILDAHTHYFARPFFETLASLSPWPGSAEEKLAELSRRTGVQVPSPDPEEHRVRFLTELDRAKVAGALCFASVPQEAAAVAAAVSASEGRLFGATVLDPTAPPAADFARRALGELGLRGLVLFPAMHGYAVSEARVRPVLEVAREARAIVIVHCGLLHVGLRDQLGIPKAYAPRLSDPLELVPVAQSLPEVSFVVPHFGAGFLRETLMACAMAPNVHVDTSSSNSWTKLHGDLGLRDVVRRFLDVAGPERILYGSDTGVMPRGYRSDLLELQAALFAELLPDAAVREQVFGGNLERSLDRAGST